MALIAFLVRDICPYTTPGTQPTNQISEQCICAGMSSNKHDPMEEFLNREKAALEALEAVEINSNNGNNLPNDNAMEIDQFGTPVTAISPTLLPATTALSSKNSSHSALSSPRPSLQTFTPTTGVTSPFTATSSATASPKMAVPTGQATFKGRTETAAMKEWKNKQTERIAQAEAEAEHIRQKRQSAAREDIDSFMREWRAGVEERQRLNRESADHVSRNVGGCVWDEEEPVNSMNDDNGALVDWKDVLGLIEALPKPAKDCSRLLGIIKSL